MERRNPNEENEEEVIIDRDEEGIIENNQWIAEMQEWEYMDKPTTVGEEGELTDESTIIRGEMESRHSDSDEFWREFFKTSEEEEEPSGRENLQKDDLNKTHMVRNEAKTGRQSLQKTTKMEGNEGIMISETEAWLEIRTRESSEDDEEEGKERKGRNTQWNMGKEKEAKGKKIKKAKRI